MAIFIDLGVRSMREIRGRRSGRRKIRWRRSRKKDKRRVRFGCLKRRVGNY
jgi:hypothetical protein